MSENAKSSPLLSSLMNIVFLVIGVGLLLGALIRWREVGPGGLIWLAGYLLSFIIRAPHGARNRKNKIAADRKGTLESILLAAMFLAMMLLPLVYLATPFLAFANYHLPIWAVVIGAVLQIPYLWLFWRSHADLGRNWSPGLEVREEHKLVTNGIYARIRHPMYAAIWCAALSQPLLIHNWIAGPLVILAFAAMYFTRVLQEEAMMRDTFGQDYDSYITKTGRLWPKRRKGS